MGLKSELSPKDWKSVRLTCMFLGFSSLACWNAILSVPQYWKTLYGSLAVMNNFTFAFNLPNVIFALYISFNSQKFTNFFTNIHISIIASLVGMLLIPILDIVHLSTEVEKNITIFLCFLLGLATALFTNSTFALSSLIDGSCVGEAMFGQGLVSLVLITVSIFFMLFPISVLLSSYCFFFTAVIFSIVTLILFRNMVKIPQIKDLIFGETSHVPLDDESISSDNAEQNSDPDAPLIDENELGRPAESIWSASPFYFTIWLNFAITLFLFPMPIEAIVNPYIDPLDKKANDWYGLLLTAIFMYCDTFGRWIAGKISLKPLAIHITGICRLIFIPIAFACKDGSNELFRSPIFHCFFVFCFATLNGVVSTLTMVIGPSSYSEKMKAQVAFVLTCCLNVGLASGIFGAYFRDNILG
eukprot:TRINITY_DN2550_c1_g1_i1.p1 TRINITY_DN2550_c1_g1~~TRINITY_DN2550_c1_g1_i1.p1  ORF type:complete len:424 (+),score=80.61 TRINITY_DN2550_c1_g1_i1:32-1273(+)